MAMVGAPGPFASFWGCLGRFGGSFVKGIAKRVEQTL